MCKCTPLILATVAVAVWSGPLLGQAQSDRTRPNDELKGLQEAAKGSPLFWDVQLVIEQYVKVMGKYYNLTDKQEQYTRELMNQRVKQFLKDYEKDVRTLMGEYVGYRSSGEMPTPEAAKDFARRAQPLMSAIREEILDGNMQWRRILNEEQLKKHDRDLEIMNRQFEYYTQSMKRWSEGDVRPSDLGIRNRNGPWATRRVEDSMGDYVAAFIARYGLDKGQQETAHSILREARQEAARYRESHKSDFAELEARQKELTASNPNNEEEQKRVKEQGRKLTEQQLELEKPLNEGLFARFKERLETIPRADQRAAYEAKQNALKERLARTRTTISTTTTIPAGSQPAEGNGIASSAPAR